MTLDEFAKKVMEPSVEQAIKSGRLDNVLLDSDVLDIIHKNPNLMAAFVSRIPALKIKYGME